jgi:hypothetical protein
MSDVGMLTVVHFNPGHDSHKKLPNSEILHEACQFVIIDERFQTSKLSSPVYGTRTFHLKHAHTATRNDCVGELAMFQSMSQRNSIVFRSYLNHGTELLGCKTSR